MGSLPANRIMTDSSTWSSSSPFHERRPAASRPPVESPPLPKKQLRFVETKRVLSKALRNNSLTCILPSSHSSSSSSCSSSSSSSGSDKENRSILKNKKSTGSGRKLDSTKRVNFRPEVAVIHFDRIEGNHVCSESQMLNSEPPADRKCLAARLIVEQSTPLTSGGGPWAQSQTDARSSPCQKTTQAKPTPLYWPLQTQTDPHAAVKFYQTHSSSTLGFSFPLGVGISASDVVVKANTSGSRVRIVGTAPDGAMPHTAQQRQINERLSLPVRIDSYRISARIDSNGNLFVEAPIIEGEKVAAAAPRELPVIAQKGT